MRTEQSSRKRTKQNGGDPPGGEFETLVIRMLNTLRGRADELSENFNKEIETIKSGDRKCKKEPVRSEEYKN